jgi:hypothetical protein
MVQLDGAGTSQTARVVIVGATNRLEICEFLCIVACFPIWAVIPDDVPAVEQK